MCMSLFGCLKSRHTKYPAIWLQSVPTLGSRVLSFPHKVRLVVRSREGSPEAKQGF